MQTTLLTIAFLLVGLAIMLLGSALLGMVLPLRAVLEGYSATAIGLIATLYFLGFIAGTLLCPLLIRRAGHIRSFTAMAAVASSSILITGLWVYIGVWLTMRFLTGVCVVGIYMVIESWLNERASNDMRGRVFAVYMMVSLASLALGQFLVLAGEVAGLELFAISALLFTLCLVPVALTRQAEPPPVHRVQLDLLGLYRDVPSGFMGSLVSGLNSGLFWALGPVFAHQSGFSATGIALFMSTTIIGGALLQWPLGLLSDRGDRRRMLILISLAGLTFAAAALLVPRDHPLWLAVCMFFFGGMLFSIYPVSSALTNDYTDPSDSVATSGNLLMVYGTGAAAGPLIGGLVIEWLGGDGLYWLFMLFGLWLAGFVRLQQRRYPDLPPEELHGQFVAQTRTSQVAAEHLAEEYGQGG